MRPLFIALFAFFASLSNAQEVQLFDLWMYSRENNNTAAFISLSDIYILSQHPDSLAVPDLKDVPAEEESKWKYFKLESKYRKRFLSAAGISETDKIYVYDYSTGVIVSFAVKDVATVAALTVYSASWPYTQDDYHIGFEINKKYLWETTGEDVLVAVAKENPFEQGQMQRIRWKKIDLTEFPKIPISPNVLKEYDYFSKLNLTIDSAFKFEHNGFIYYRQEFSGKESYINWSRVLILSAKSKEVVMDDLFRESESASLAPLDYQWTGRLLKNRPYVLLGMEWVSFGCPIISLIQVQGGYIGINCDNRH